MKALVLGSAGQLGSTTVAAWKARGHDVTGLARTDLDVTRDADVRASLDRARPDVVLNCVAFNHVDRAEDEPTAALAVNAWAVRSIARAADAVGAVLVHYSTDFVFDGETTRPYVEEDPPNPLSAYGASKLMGEWMAGDAPRAYVLRVESLFGGSMVRSSIDLMIARFLAGQPVQTFSDRVVSPSYVPDVVAATLALVERAQPPGLYHCVNTGFATWLELAEELRRLLHCPDASIVSRSFRDAGLRAARPRFAALSNAKLASQEIALPAWRDALAQYVARIATRPAPPVY